jgi:hypothetical protein
MEVQDYIARIQSTFLIMIPPKLWPIKIILLFFSYTVGQLSLTRLIYMELPQPTSSLFRHVLTASNS